MKRSAFTLIELLVVVSIIAILASLLMPAIGMVRRAALAAGCLSNQRQILLAIEAYTQDKDGYLPYSFDAASRYWPYTANVGEFLGLTYAGSGSIRNAQGPWKVLKCGTNTQSPNGISYGLNHRFCVDVQLPTNPPAVHIATLRKLTSIAVMTDTAGEGRIYIYSPLYLFGNNDPSQTPSWSVNYPYNQPFLPVPRHNGGMNVGFLDGHARWSPNLAVEDTAQTVILRLAAAL